MMRFLRSVPPFCQVPLGTGVDRKRSMGGWGRGFTLIEILIAFGILALVMGVVYSSVTSSLYVTRYVEQRAEIYHAGRQIMSRLQRELASAYLKNAASGASPYTFFKGEHDEVEGRRMDRLSFTTLGHRMNPFPPPGEHLSQAGQDSEFATVAYYWKIEYQDDQKTLVTLFYRESTGFAADVGGEEYEIFKGLRELDIRYFQGSNGAWIDWWDSRAIGFLPTAVDISFVLADSNGVEVPFRALMPLALAK